MNKLDILIKARKLLSDPRRWRKGSYVAPDASVDGGFCYCAMGALEAAGGTYELDPDSGTFSYVSNSDRDPVVKHAMWDAMLALRREVPLGVSIERFNDRTETTYEDVLKLFSDAIQAEVANQQAVAA